MQFDKFSVQQCNWCKQWHPFTVLRLVGKGQKDLKFKCKGCACTQTQMYRKFGTWPTQELMPVLIIMQWFVLH